MKWFHINKSAEGAQCRPSDIRTPKPLCIKPPSAWGTSNNRAERTPLEGRKPEPGQHGCARTATLGRAGRLYNAMNLGRHWQGCLCREVRDGLQGLYDELSRAIRERLVQYRDALR
ncbi:MAG: hypothetical protein LUQ29_10945 [Methylococcaceae bacterium]|nr:hypothetical protein [Methylococcaceae bacterium]